jgi:Spy/CpxP family protein refolding chaperone
MKRVLSLLILGLILCPVVFAQAQPNPQRGPTPGFNFEPPRALSGDWWRDPDVINELRLTDAQRRQLEQSSLSMKLSLISAAATAASAFVKGESALNGDQLDESAYNQEVNAAADAASKLVKDAGGTMLAMRRILSPEQWRKLESMRHVEREMRRPIPRDNERRPAPPQQ